VDPFDPYIKCGARVIQRGDSAYVQIRFWKPTSGCTALSWLWRSPRDISYEEIMYRVMEDDPGTNTGDPWFSWRTVAMLSGRVANMGIFASSNTGIFLTLSSKLCLFHQGNITPVSTADLAENLPQPGPALLPDGRIMLPYRFRNPATGAYEGGTYPEDADRHDAPKWTRPAPEGDFAFGGLLSLDSCSIVTWAGGAPGGVGGWYVVGNRHSKKLNDFILPWSAETKKKKQEEPLAGKYKMLFCVASRENNITGNHVDGLDNIRRAWETYFPLISDRNADTLIDFS
jgi:hypothetical protein